VAVAIGQIAFGRGADVGEDQRGRRLGRDSREVDAIPCWDGGGEDAGFGAERGRRVVANAEAIAVVWTSAVLWAVSRVRVGSQENNSCSLRDEGASRRTVSRSNVKDSE
jgi:hypothetical protein